MKLTGLNFFKMSQNNFIEKLLFDNSVDRLQQPLERNPDPEPAAAKPELTRLREAVPRLYSLLSVGMTAAITAAATPTA